MTYWIMQPWPFDIRNTSRYSPLASIRISAVVEHVGDFDAGKSRRDMERGDLLRNVEDATAIVAATPPRRGGVEAVAPWNYGYSRSCQSLILPYALST